MSEVRTRGASQQEARGCTLCPDTDQAGFRASSGVAGRSLGLRTQLHYFRTRANVKEKEEDSGCEMISLFFPKDITRLIK